MANRDAKLIERTLKDFSLGAMSGNGGGEGGSSLYTYYVETMDIGQFTYTFTFQCDNPGLDSYDKLAQYLLSKGYCDNVREGKGSYCPILNAVSYMTYLQGAITGLFVDNTSLSDGQLIIELSTIYISSGSLSTNMVELKSDNFDIFLVTE